MNGKDFLFSLNGQVSRIHFLCIVFCGNFVELEIPEFALEFFISYDLG